MYRHNVQFLDIESAGKNIGIHLPLFEQSLNIGCLKRVIHGTVSVTTAEVTVVLTVGNMNVQTDTGGLITVVETFNHRFFPLILGNTICAP